MKSKVYASILVALASLFITSAALAKKHQDPVRLAKQAIQLARTGHTAQARAISLELLKTGGMDMVRAGRVPGFITHTVIIIPKQKAGAGQASTASACWYDSATYNFHAPGGANIASITKTVTWCGDHVIILSASWGHKTWTWGNACLSNVSNYHGWLNWPFSQHGYISASVGVYLVVTGCFTYSPVEKVGLNIYADGGDIKFHT